MPNRENLKLVPFTEQDKKSDETPEYKQKLTITPYFEMQKIDIIDLWGQLKKQREPFESEWKLLDNVYDGEIDHIQGQQFNIHYGIMSEKIDNAVNRIDLAFFDGERIFDVSARPDFEKAGGADVCQNQSDFLDYTNEEIIKPREQVNLSFHSAALKGNGWLFGTRRVKKVPQRERRKFKGTPKYLIMQPDGNFKETTKRLAEKYTKDTGEPYKYENKGLEEFLKAFPDYEGTGYLKKLDEGKEVKIVAQYDEVVYNDPHFETVDLMDLWIDKDVDCLEDIANTKLIVHRKEYTYWELRKLQDDGIFDNVDDLLFEHDENGVTSTVIPDAENLKYDILRCTYKTKVSDGANIEERFIFWIAERNNILLAVERFEHDRIKTEYIPFFVKKKKKGLYQPGIGKDLVDDNISLDLMVNFTLQVLYLHSMVTPICDSESSTAEQFMNREFVNGYPIYKDKSDVPLDFLQNHMKYPDVASILAMMNKLEARAGTKANVTPGMEGKENPNDPSAPGNKTIALLGESNYNFKKYVHTLAQNFNEIGYIELAIYHQMDKDKIPFRRSKGTEFGEITRDELVMRTEIQTQAMVFAIDKLNEKRELIAFMQVMRPEMRDMKQITALDRFITKAWSPKLRSNVDLMFPELEDVEREKLMIAMQAVHGYMTAQQKVAQDSGAMPQLDAGPLMQQLNQMFADYANPPDEKELKKREREAKNPQ